MSLHAQKPSLVRRDRPADRPPLASPFAPLAARGARFSGAGAALRRDGGGVGADRNALAGVGGLGSLGHGEGAAGQRGDRVEPGQVLLVLDDAPLRARMEEVEAQLLQLRERLRPETEASLSEAVARRRQAERDARRARELARGG